MIGQKPLWAPSRERAEATQLAAFRRHVASQWEASLPDYSTMHDWSVQHPDRFWTSVWDHAGLVGERGDVALEPGAAWWQTRFFPDARVSYAENLLAHGDDAQAVIAVDEDGSPRSLTWRELRALVARIQRALQDAGVEPGDRVAAWLPNIPECLALMLAVSGLGAVFSSCSPDFGPGAVIDRFGQITPTVLVAIDGYRYDGKRHDCLERLREVRPQLPSVRCVPIVQLDPSEPWRGDDIEGATPFSSWLGPDDLTTPEFRRLPFDHPLYILYSSGTTGAPKCIVHRAGGILLKHAAELRLQCDVRRDDRVVYFTTTGWMMWNWLASVLGCGATVVLYDGSPMARDGSILFDISAEHGLTLFGTSAKFLDSARQRGLAPADTHDLGALRTITSTGSPLAPESFAYVYRSIKSDVHLASISGGTDLCGCLVAGDPTGPVWSGEIQRPALGLAIDVFDERGASLGPGERGELVCTTPFPSIPLGLWGDDGRRLRATYFDAYPGAWHQGDFAERTDHGGFVILGRSDATLNPGGVRLGTAEIYRAAESVDGVAETLVIGQEWEGDTRIVLFVVLDRGVELSDELVRAIKMRIREQASPRHVPARIVAVHDIPRTRSGKLAELSVRDIVHGRDVTNREALANPECLDEFHDLEVLRT